MRVKVGKLSKKTIQYYKINFGFFEPFKVLIDGPFLKKCLDKKINIQLKLEKIFGGKIQLYTTSCIIGELNELGDEYRKLLIEAKRLQKHKCGHQNHVEASQCVKDCLGTKNEHKLAIATQDDTLINDLRNITGVPTIHVVQGKIFIDDPSELDKQQAELQVSERMKMTKREKAVIKPVIFKMRRENKREKFVKLKKQRRAAGVRVQKNARGPNPLSMKRKKPQAQSNDE